MKKTAVHTSLPKETRTLASACLAAELARALAAAVVFVHAPVAAVVAAAELDPPQNVFAG